MFPNTAQQEHLFGSVLRELRSLGYSGELLQRKYTFQDWFSPGQPFREAPAVAFGQAPVSYGTSCFAVVMSGVRKGFELIADYRALGAPIAFEVQNDRVVQWKVTTSPSISDQRRTIMPNAIANTFAEAKGAWSPSSVLRAKNISTSESRQIELDFGLLPSIESEIRTRLDPLLRDVLAGAEDLLRTQQRPQDPADLFRLVFWFLAGKVLHDRGIDPFDKLSASNASKEVLTCVADYYVEKAPNASGAVLDFIRQRLWSGFDFRNLSVDILALIYENTLVERTLRDLHGIHATPPSLARYIVNHLPFEDFSQDDRTVLEPCCGHGTFLLAAMNRLRELLHPPQTAAKRHDYFKQMLCGFELDPFALEVTRLSLMLADFPNHDGWHLLGGQEGDVFRSDQFPMEVKKANIVLCNPPFTKFTFDERNNLKTQSVNMPGELLHRVLDNLGPRGVIGIIVPHKMLDGHEFRKIRRRLVDRYDDVQIVSLPDHGVFEEAEIETALLICRHPQSRPAHVSITHLKVDSKDWPQFRTRFEASRTNHESKMQAAAAESFCVADLREIWERLGNHPTLSDATSHIGRGIEWNVPLEPNRNLLISLKPKPGFAEGLESKAHGFYAFQRPQTTYLCVQGKYRRGNAHDLSWDQPKVIVNASRRRRGRWRLSAFSDASGLICYQTFTGVWPTADWSPMVLAAILNSVVANCFVAAHENTRHITNQMLDRIPLPTAISVDFKQIEERVKEYLAAVDRNPLSASDFPRTPADILNEIDDMVLRGYQLGASDEKTLRDYLIGADRPVPEEASIGGWWMRSTEKFSIQYRPMAELVLRSLEPNDRTAVLGAIDKLRTGLTLPSVADARKIPGSPDLYILQVTKSLCVIFLARPDRTIMVQDVINNDIVGQYFSEVRN